MRRTGTEGTQRPCTGQKKTDGADASGSREVLRVSGLKLKPNHTKADLEAELRRLLRLKGQPFAYEILRQSIDARRKPEIWFVYTIEVRVGRPREVLRHIRDQKVELVEKQEYRFPCVQRQSPLPPVVAGSGPAGLFCALLLARAGLRPIVLERGERVEERTRTVAHFWETGELNPDSNVQFGEGGAGTFSDGKLNTQIKDPEGRIRFVLKEFVKAGADPAILYQQKPHLGTDVLTGIVGRIRREILSLGGQFRFGCCLTGIRERANGPGRYLLELNGGKESLAADDLVLAIGHSARDTVAMLYRLGLSMEAKSFAVGLRIQHPQPLIDEAMYGRDCPYDLGAAPYRVSHKCRDGRGVYSFCMCPGGYVVNASSEPGRLAINGMSYADRASGNANSALAVTVSPADYGGDSPLSGIAFQRQLEEAAFCAGGGRLPLQRFDDFAGNRGPGTAFPGRDGLRPQVKGLYRYANVREILPESLNLPILEAMEAFGRQIPGFDRPDALLSGVESRTSSPVRILRGENGEAPFFPGIYPCGEGAGYAGGITSAAVDGLRTAEALCRRRN